MTNLLFIELLQVSLGARDKLSRAPSEAEWTSLFRESLRQVIPGTMMDGMERLPQEQLPKQSVLLQWVGMVQRNEWIYRLHCERAKDLTSLLREMRCPSCVLKGIGFAKYYPKPSRRQCGDIDIWVGGDRKKDMSFFTRKYEVTGVVWHHVVVQFFKDVETEIHFYPIWLYNPLYNARLQEWFEGEKDRQMLKDEDLEVVFPSVEFDAVYSLMHSFHHLIDEGLGLRHIVDYFYILKDLPVDQRPVVFKCIKSLGLSKYAGAMMWVMRDICGMSDEFLICEPNETSGQFLDEVMRGGNFGHYRKDDRQRNSITRFISLLPHYPSEMLWIVPWKLWHKCWRACNR